MIAFLGLSFAGWVLGAIVTALLYVAMIGISEFGTIEKLVDIIITLVVFLLLAAICWLIGMALMWAGVVV